MKSKGFIIFLITYLIATLIRAITGIPYNPFYDKFDLIFLIKDFSIWAFSFIGVSLIISKFTKQNNY